jgi:chromosome segregation ATPase
MLEDDNAALVERIATLEDSLLGEKANVSSAIRKHEAAALDVDRLEEEKAEIVQRLEALEDEYKTSLESIDDLKSLLDAAETSTNETFSQVKSLQIESSQKEDEIQTLSTQLETGLKKSTDLSMQLEQVRALADRSRGEKESLEGVCKSLSAELDRYTKRTQEILDAT